MKTFILSTAIALALIATPNLTSGATTPIVGGASFSVINSAQTSGSFIGRDGGRIEFKILVGEPNNHGSDAPPYAIDIMISDEAGPFLIQIGGSGLSDPTWANAIARANTLAEWEGLALSAERTQSFRIAHEFVESLQGGYLQLRGGNLSAVQMDALAGLVASVDIDMLTRESDDTVTSPEELMGGSSSATTYYQHEVDAWWKYAFVPVAHPFGDHSATSLTSWNMSTRPWTLVAYTRTCNHGACATDSGMRGYCRDVYPYRTNPYPWGFGDVGCDRWTLYGFFYGQHLCNDDTAQEFWSVRNNDTGPRWYSVCSDLPYLWKPTCWSLRGY